MASKSAPSLTQHPDWNLAQKIQFARVIEAVPIALGYTGNEIPILDNHTDKQLVDEVGVLKQAKKLFEKAEKAHVERLKVRMNNIIVPSTEEGKKPTVGVDFLDGDGYQAAYRGGKRTILNQELCKEIVAAFDEEGISIKRLLEEIQEGALADMPQGVLDTMRLNEGETNFTVFHTTSDGGRSLYVEPI